MGARRFIALLAAFLAVLAVRPDSAQSDDWRTLEFETTEATFSDVALSPDGESLIFTMVGHLFRLPVRGGTADQLTFGPYYDTDPVFSPDGTRVAFVSDRDGSDGNVFLLEVASGQITQMTHEIWAGRPTWSPDGQALAYLRYLRSSPGYEPRQGNVRSDVRRVGLDGGPPEVLTAARRFRSVFHLPDGRLAWTVLQGGELRLGQVTPAGADLVTRLEVVGADGAVSTLRTLEGIVDRVVPSASDDGLYVRRFIPQSMFAITRRDDVLLLSFARKGERHVIAASGSSYAVPRFALSADGGALYLGDAGQLWQVSVPDGFRQRLPFEARVRMDVRAPLPPARWVAPEPGTPAPPRVLWATEWPGGRGLLIGAAGRLWRQPADGGPAQRWVEGFDSAFSPDGGRLAFVNRDGIMVVDTAGGEPRLLLVAEDPEDLSWSPDGNQIAFFDADEDVKVLDLATDDVRTIASGQFHPRLSWSPDASTLMFCDHDEGDAHRVVAVNLNTGATTTVADDLPQTTRAVQISADGDWLVFSRGAVGIWVAALREGVIDGSIRELTPDGHGYSLTADGLGVIYVVGNRLFRQSLDGREREEVPVRVQLERPAPPPLLVRRVRVLDFASGRFGPETSVYIERGRVSWIGSEEGRRLPRETTTLDAEGRFAIPGLFDMHVHPGIDPRASVAYGITSVRILGRSIGGPGFGADRSETTDGPMPRYFYAGQLSETSDGLPIQTEMDVRAVVPALKAAGAQLIKLHWPYAWRLHRAVAEEARRQGLPVIGHGLSAEEVTKNVTQGFATLEHHNRFYDDILQLIAAAGTVVDPTLVAEGGAARLFRWEPERLLDRKLRTFISGERLERASVVETRLFYSLGDDSFRGRWIDLLRSLRRADELGVPLLVGTDAPGAVMFSGVSLHWELELLVEAGLTPLEVLRMATSQAAEAVGAGDDLGRLDVGMLADLVLLDGNPLQDIRNTQTIWRVMKGGQLFDAEALGVRTTDGTERRCSQSGNAP